MTTPAKIEPWMKLAAEHIEDAYTVAIQQQVVGTEPAIVEVAYIIAAHAPKQEPSVPGSKPRFDDIYYDGVAWLDKLDGT